MSSTSARSPGTPRWAPRARTAAAPGLRCPAHRAHAGCAVAQHTHEHWTGAARCVLICPLAAPPRPACRCLALSRKGRTRCGVQPKGSTSPRGWRHDSAALPPPRTFHFQQPGSAGLSCNGRSRLFCKHHSAHVAARRPANQCSSRCLSHRTRRSRLVAAAVVVYRGYPWPARCSERYQYHFQAFFSALLPQLLLSLRVSLLPPWFLTKSRLWWLQIAYNAAECGGGASRGAWAPWRQSAALPS